MGREEPAMSMDNSGKIIFAKHSEILQANLKNLGESDCKDGERLPVAVKEMGSCEIYPQTLSHNPNGRYHRFLRLSFLKLSLVGGSFSNHLEVIFLSFLLNTAMFM